MVHCGMCIVYLYYRYVNSKKTQENKKKHTIMYNDCQIGHRVGVVVVP